MLNSSQRHSSLMHRLLAPAALAALVVPSMSACASSEGEGKTASIAVTATDTTCQLSRTDAAAGAVSFVFTNNEFYVFGAGDTILGEAEDVGPGLSRTLTVTFDKPGSYETACKPGATGEGIRADFTVTAATS